MIVVMGGQKGGPGKSTLAVHAAVLRAMQGRSVVLVDTDPQQTALRWIQRRNVREQEPALTAVAVYGELVGKDIADLAKRYDDVVVDTPGARSKELNSALVPAHRLVSPIQSSWVDLETMGAMQEIVDLIRTVNPGLQALVAINRSKSTRDRARAQDALKGMPAYTLAGAVISDRIAFMHCADLGLAVCEMRKAVRDERAVEEVGALAEEIWA